MFCPKCGEQVATQNAVFCSACGSKLPLEKQSDLATVFRTCFSSSCS
ncbi:zinc-ribbon domain-containing protein [Halomonas sediminis]